MTSEEDETVEIADVDIDNDTPPEVKTNDTDYNFPEGFFTHFTDEERHIWMTQDRCYRQAYRQHFTFVTPDGKQYKR